MSDIRQKIYHARSENKQKILAQISILDLAREMGFNVLPHGKQFKLQEHDSCVLYPDTNTYKRYSTGNPRGDVFDFLKEFCDMNFNQAFDFLLQKIDPTKAYVPKAEKVKAKRILTAQQRTRSLQEQLREGLDSHCRNAIAYLIQVRRIHPKIVFEYAHKNMIKQTRLHGTPYVVFLGYDENGMLAAAKYRSCRKDISSRGDFNDCDYRYCWMYEPDIDNSAFCPAHNWQKPCIVTESSIDSMALMSMMLEKQLEPDKYQISEPLTKLLTDNQFDYRKFNWLSLESVNHYNVISDWMNKFGIKEWVLATDNDEHGRNAAAKMQELVSKAGGKSYAMFPTEKDWDEERVAFDMPLEQRIAKGKQIQSTQNHDHYMNKDIKEKTKAFEK